MQELAEAPSSGFEAAEFKDALRRKLNEVMPAPNSAEDAQKSLQSGTAHAAGSAMRGELDTRKDRATGGMEAAAGAAPDPARFPQAPPPGLPPPPPASAPALLDPKGAVPPPLPPAALDTRADRSEADRQMTEARLTPEKLARANEPSFAAAGAARQQAEGHSRTGPAEVRQAEAQLRGQAQAEAAPALAQGMGALVRARGGAFGRVASQQGATKSQDEAARERVSTQLDAIQTRTRADVQKTLDEMDAEATRLFEAGLARALQAFERERERLEEEARREQASEWFNTAGLLGAIVGYFWSLGKERVERAIAGARAAYDNVVRETIDQVAAVIGGKLTVAKDRVRQGRAEADALVGGLPAELQTFGQEARAKLDGEFERMAGDIEERKGGLIDRLGEKYAESRRQVDERAQAFRDANKSLWDRAKEAVAGVIQTIMEFRALLLGILAKAAGVVDSILDDPIRFLRNLVSGVKAGLDAFIANIVNHLKAGFMQWLFGTLAAAGIQIPERFDLKGIFGLILSVLGLTYANIRARAVRLLGEPLVARLEAVAEVFKILITEGPAGLWRMLLERLEALKEQVLGQVREMLITQVLKAGVVWLIGLLNPASAFVKACKAIYDIVMFFVERGRQIAELVNSILDSLAAIVAGNLGAMARAVEGALARAVPVVIGFLASLLGLGGLSEKIKKIIEKIQEPVNKAIDWVIGKAVELARKIGGALGIGAPRAGRQDTDARGGADKDLVELPFAMSGHAHHLYLSRTGDTLQVRMASVSARELDATLKAAIAKANSKPLLKALRKVEKQLGDYYKFIYTNLDALMLPNHPHHAELTARARTQLADMVQRLVEIGKEFDVPDLVALGHPSIYVKGSEIKEEYRGHERMRSTFYMNGWPSHVLAWYNVELAKLKTEAQTHPKWALALSAMNASNRSRAFVVRDRQGKFPTSPYLDTVRPRNTPIDHIEEVATHFNKPGGGNDQKQPQREAWYGNTSNLQILNQHENSAKGGPAYIYNVTINFRGPDD